MRKDKVTKFIDSLYRYENYRDFLKDYFTLQKSLRAQFSQRSFAQRAGLTSHTFCSYVLNGKRNLSAKTIEAFATTIGLDATKSSFFTSLVHFTQCEEQNEKVQYYEEMQRIRKITKFKTITHQQSSFYEKPYNAVIRELAVHAPWNGSFETLAKMVYPSITKTEAKASVEFLVENGLLLEKDGNYSFNQDNLNDDDVPVFFKKKARRQVFERGVELLDNLSPDQRYAAYTTFMADKKTYQKIEQEFIEFRKRVYEHIEQAESKDEVFQMTHEVFPVSRNVKDFIRKEQL